MLKFIHKNNIDKNPGTNKLVVYYNLSDIILGFLLIVLVTFFIYSYLELNLFKINSTSTSGTFFNVNNLNPNTRAKTK